MVSLDLSHQEGLPTGKRVASGCYDVHAAQRVQAHQSLADMGEGFPLRSWKPPSTRKRLCFHVVRLACRD